MHNGQRKQKMANPEDSLLPTSLSPQGSLPVHSSTLSGFLVLFLLSFVKILLIWATWNSILCWVKGIMKNYFNSQHRWSKLFLKLSTCVISCMPCARWGYEIYIPYCALNIILWFHLPGSPWFSFFCHHLCFKLYICFLCLSVI